MDAPDRPNPDRIMQFAWGFALTQTLTTAIQLDLFTAIAQGRNTLRDLSAAAVRPEAIGRVLDVMIGAGLVLRRGDRYSLAPDAEQFLVRGKPSFLGDFVVFHQNHIAPKWTQLTEVVRSGRPAQAVDRPEEGIPLWHQLVDSLFAVNFMAAQTLGRELAKLHPQGPIQLLDVACGSGVWGIGAALVEPRVTVTAYDLPATLQHTARMVDRHKLDDRFEWIEGDLRETNPGSAMFDAAVLGHICHSEGPEHTPNLLAQMYKALKPGGTLAIAEFVPDDDRNGPLRALVFGINMLVNTTDGDVFTLAQYRRWLEEAGFKDVRTLEAEAPSPLILATR